MNKRKGLESLPMKLRTLPNSFWQQPNKTQSASPGLNFKDNLFIEDYVKVKKIEVISNANIELLFSLFRGFDKKNQLKIKQRGRPKNSKAKTIRDEDPYLASNQFLVPLSPNKQKVFAVMTQPNNYSKILTDLVTKL